MILTAIGDRIYGETPEDGIVARVYGDPELARQMAAAPETAAERDRLKALNAEMLEALKGMKAAATSEFVPVNVIRDAGKAIAKAEGEEEG